MNQLRSNVVSKRFLNAIRGSVIGSPKLRRLSSAAESGEEPRRRSRRNEAKTENEFLERFKLRDDATETPTAEKLSPPQSSPPESSDEIFRKMKETGLIPNAVAMLDGLCQDGLVKEAMNLFSKMREKGTIPEVVVYTAVVEGFCKAQKLDDAVRVFRKMETSGIAPNAFTYNLLVRGLCNAKRCDEGVEFCLEMLGSGKSPNVTVFVELVDALCHEKGVEDAKAVVGTMTDRGFALNEPAVRDFLDKRSGFSPAVLEAIFGTSEQQVI